MLRAGANLRQIQELLGHKHLDSTQRYTRVNAHELEERLNGCDGSDSGAGDQREAFPGFG